MELPWRKNNTSWGHVANWYDKHLAAPDTYHEKVLKPNLLRLVDPRAGEDILDLGCGQGYFHACSPQKGRVSAQ